MEAKAATVVGQLPADHISNRDFRFNSQPLECCIHSPREYWRHCLAKRDFTETRFNYAFSIWCNSTLGLLAHWWHSSRQHRGKRENVNPFRGFVTRCLICVS